MAKKKVKEKSKNVILTSINRIEYSNEELQREIERCKIKDPTIIEHIKSEVERLRGEEEYFEIRHYLNETSETLGIVVIGSLSIPKNEGGSESVGISCSASYKKGDLRDTVEANIPLATSYCINKTIETIASGGFYIGKGEERRLIDLPKNRLKEVRFLSVLELQEIRKNGE